MGPIVTLALAAGLTGSVSLDARGFGVEDAFSNKTHSSYVILAQGADTVASLRRRVTELEQELDYLRRERGLLRGQIRDLLEGLNQECEDVAGADQGRGGDGGSLPGAPGGQGGASGGAAASRYGCDEDTAATSPEARPGRNGADGADGPSIGSGVGGRGGQSGSGPGGGAGGAGGGGATGGQGGRGGRGGSSD